MSVHGQLYDYYISLVKAHGGVPPRSAFDPVQIRSILAWVFLSEVRSNSEVVPTVTGSQIDEIVGSSFTNKNLFDFFPKKASRQLTVFQQKVLRTPCGGRSVSNLTSQYGTVMGFELQSMPLKDKTGKVNLLIGTMSYAGVNKNPKGYGEASKIEVLDFLEMSFFDIGFGVPK